MIARVSRKLGKWAREPLWHFVALGATVFLLYQGLSPADTPIWVSRAHVEALRQDHLSRTGLLPTPAEESALIARFVEDEVLLREAIRMDLDRGDPIVRRRLIQRMGFLVEQQNPVTEPTYAELTDYFEQNQQRYAKEGRISLTHVFLNRNGSVDEVRSEARSLLEELTTGKDPEQLGDPFILGSRFERKTGRELAAIFGSRFSGSANALEEGIWNGPIESSYGLHLVLITGRAPPRVPAFEEVQPLVLEHLMAARREETRRAAIQRLQDRYEIRLEGRDKENDAAAMRLIQKPLI